MEINSYVAQHGWETTYYDTPNISKIIMLEIYETKKSYVKYTFGHMKF